MHYRMEGSMVSRMMVSMVMVNIERMIGMREKCMLKKYRKDNLM